MAKRFLTTGLIGLIVLTGLIAPFGIDVAQGEGGTAGAVVGAIFGRFSFLDMITFFLAELGNAVLTIAGKILDMAGAVLNLSVSISIGKVSDLLTKVPVVDVGWTVFRDIANLFFIFILLWTGIRIILGINAGAAKGLVGWVVLMALLINFSLFITKAIVDSGNIPALHFYNAMRPDLLQPGSTEANPIYVMTTDDRGNQVRAKAGLSDIYMDGLKLQTFMGEPSTAKDKLASAGGFAQQFTKILIATFFGTIFFLVTAFVFFFAAYCFIQRAVVLMFLMLLSPLAFAAHAFPSSQASGLASKWWKRLFCETFYAPIYMALAYVVARAIQNGGFGTLLHITGNQQSFAALMNAPASENVGIIINYIFLIGLMWACTKIPKEMGCATGEFILNWGKQLQGIGMGMITGGIGGAAARVLGGAAKAMTGRLQGTTHPFGRAALRAADRLQNVKLGGKSYKEQQEKGTFFQVGEEEAEKNLTKTLKGKPSDQAAYLAKLNPKMQGKMYEKMSTRDRAAIEAAGVKVKPDGSSLFTAKQFADMRSKMSVEEREKTEKEIKKSNKDEEARQREKDLGILKEETNLANLAQKASDARAGGIPLNTKESGDLNKLKTILSQVSDKEVKELGTELVTALAPFLSSSQYMAIQTGDELGTDEKNAVEMARYSTLNTNVMRAQDTMLPAADRAKATKAVEEDMKNYKAKERVNLDEKLLAQETVVASLNEQDLKEIAKQNTVSGTTLATIKNTIEGWKPVIIMPGAPPIPANQQRLLDFLASTTGKDIFG